jgi:hypothetical protein
MEHLWDKVKHTLRNFPSKPASREDLWDKLQDVWEGIEVEECIKLIGTMPQRLQDVLNARGEYTRW